MGKMLNVLLYISLQYTDGDCSHEIKRRLLLGRKVMTNLDSILKSRVNVKIPAENIYVFGCLRLWQLSRLFHLVNIY